MSTWGKNNPDQTPKMSWSLEESKGKLETFCAYQERCAWEVRRKLYEKSIKGDAVDQLIDTLTKDGFLNEERFARAFARGKFRIKKWGRNRITRELKLREIPTDLIRKALLEIDPDEYYEVLVQATEKKWEKTIEKDPYKKRFKVIQYLISKGFEQDLVKEAIGSIQ
ncbi:regulatory protein [Algoriphagus boseongensis]|uniref:Regulatory protein RecX n=1 Tax=Algoriphagus boseongensis TaxID=1442587 RepID=A0A4R6T8B8_9BACT|nr:regulatory protein RecX [Algoriphagus boseongensis]TDQ17198.1 regulatory protein [Algoriphagus boseongensis]